MKKIFRTLTSLLVLGCLGSSVYAQVVQRDLLSSKFPITAIQQYLPQKAEWNPFPKTAAEWAGRVSDSVRSALLQQAETALHQPFQSIPATVTLEYVRTGNRTNYERLSFEKRNRLFTLVLAEAMENKGRFTDAIANGVWNICEETYWGVTAHIGSQKRGSGLPDVSDPTVDLFGAETAAVLALTDYFVGNQLDKVSPLLRERISIEVNRKILNSYENEIARYGYLGNGKRNIKVNNWDPWVVSNCITAFLLLEKNQDRRVKLMQQSLSLLDLYINGLGEDGATDEGPSYWFAAGLALYDALAMIADVTGGRIQVFDHPIIQKLGAYIYQTHIDEDYFVNVADANPRIKADGVAIYRFGKSVKDATMMGFGAWAYHHIQDNAPKVESFFKPRQLYNLLATAECAAAPEQESRLKNMYLPSVELMTARTDNNLFVSAHGGNNAESHNHNDVGDFTVYADGAPVIIDAGRGTYMAVTFSKNRYTLWYNTSPYHNLPFPNGAQQEAIAAAQATDVHFASEKGITRFSMELASAFPAAAQLQHWNRTVLLDEHRNFVEISDAYRFAKPDPKLTQTFMTVCETDITAPGQLLFTTEKNKKVLLQYNAADWSVTKERMPLTEPHEQGLKTNWNNRPIWRILLTSRVHKQEGRFVYTIKKTEE